MAKRKVKTKKSDATKNIKCKSADAVYRIMEIAGGCTAYGDVEVWDKGDVLKLTYDDTKHVQTVMVTDSNLDVHIRFASGQDITLPLSDLYDLHWLASALSLFNKSETYIVKRGIV